MTVYVAVWSEDVPEDLASSEEGFTQDEVLGVYSSKGLADQACSVYVRGRLEEDGDPDAKWEDHADGRFYIWPFVVDKLDNVYPDA